MRHVKGGLAHRSEGELHAWSSLTRAAPPSQVLHRAVAAVCRALSAVRAAASSPGAPAPGSSQIARARARGPEGVSSSRWLPRVNPAPGPHTAVRARRALRLPNGSAAAARNSPEGAQQPRHNQRCNPVAAARPCLLCVVSLRATRHIRVRHAAEAGA